jgi:hypothetical protein
MANRDYLLTINHKPNNMKSENAANQQVTFERMTQKEGWNPGIHDADCFYHADPEPYEKEAPGMGFEPMRTGRSTGSQGPRVNRSAIPAMF